MKRGRGDTLTGGSKDVNPQTMITHVSQTAADVTASQALALPIPRLPIAKGRSLVIELLGIDFYNLSATQILANNVLVFLLTTNGTTPTSVFSAMTDPKTLALWDRWVAFGTGVGFAVFDNSKHVDLTDNAGHGILVATDQIFFYLLSQTTGALNTGICKMTYRFKDVSLEEYIGIVQSQQ